MAVALVIFARWNPLRCVLAALLFGAAGAIGPALQSVGITQGYYFFNAAPYILTLAIMIATSSAKRSAARHARRTHHGRSRTHADHRRRSLSLALQRRLRPENTALIIIDMQTDFCGKGGYVDKMGYDLSLTRAPIEPITARARRDAREGLPRHPHPRGPSARPRRSARQQALALAPHRRRHRRSRPLRQDPGARRAGLGHHRRTRRRCPARPIIDKPGKGSFCATDLELILRTRGIDNLVLTGITTDVCVHTTMREANDRGFECLLLEDCCAATDRGNHVAAIKMVKMQGGVFGAVANSKSLRRGAAMSGVAAAPPSAALTRAPSLETVGMTKSFGALHRARQRLDQGRAPARSTRCSARTAPASRRWSNASWASTRPTRAS